MLGELEYKVNSRTLNSSLENRLQHPKMKVQGCLDDSVGKVSDS